jgi:hypothetical protein
MSQAKERTLYNEADSFLTERQITFANEYDRIAGTSLMAEFAELQRDAGWNAALEAAKQHIILVWPNDQAKWLG